MQKVGIALVVIAYAVLVYISLESISFAHAHPHLEPTVLGQYHSPWPAALGCSLALVGIVLALIPIRRGERWAVLVSFAVFIILVATRMATDPRCLVVLDPHQHGCHTFMIAMVLGVVGLALTGLSKPSHRVSS